VGFCGVVSSGHFSGLYRRDVLVWIGQCPDVARRALVDRGTSGYALGFDHHLSQVWASGYRNDADGRLPVFL